MRIGVDNPMKDERISGTAVASIGFGVICVILLGAMPQDRNWSMILVFGLMGLVFGMDGIRQTQHGAMRGRLFALCGITACAIPLLVGAFPPPPTQSPAHSSRTIRNLKQLSLAVQQYAQDYGDAFPGWTRPRHGRPYHNVWDEQVSRGGRLREEYRDFEEHRYGPSWGIPTPIGRGIQSPSQLPFRDRVLSFGLNGLLLTRPKREFDGNPDWESGPRVTGPSRLGNPAGTILLAELATEAPMGGRYADPGAPLRPGACTPEYHGALRMWIDVDPRAWVETTGPASSYDPLHWDASRGVARALHGGGACYAFCDGHVQFMKLVKTVGIGETVEGQRVTPDNCWDPWNTCNMWNPQ